MTTVVAKTRRTILPADERYKDAIDALHEALGDGVAFAHAQAWAIEQCGKAEHYDWSVSNRFAETWEGASAAARKLAEHLELGGEFGIAARISQAEKQIGMKLRFDSKEPNDASADGKVPKTPGRAKIERYRTMAAAFPELLLALSEQPVPPQQRERLLCGPLMFSARKRTRRPSRPEALAIALTHGFRVISAAVDDSMPTAVEPFMRFKRKGGKPCYAAAGEFANATFQDDKKTSVEAITKYLSRNGSGLRFWGFPTERRPIPDPPASRHPSPD